MFCKEIKRIINVPTIIILVAFTLAYILLIYVQAYKYSTREEKCEKYYKEYVDTYGMEVTKEQAELIDKESQFIKDTIDKENEMESEYIANKITSAEYQRYLDDKYYAYNRSASIEKLKNQFQKLMETSQKGREVSLVYETGWDFYWNMNVATFLEMILVMLLVIRYVSEDYVSGMWKMMHTYYNGKRKLLNTRLKATVLLCAIISAIYSCVQFIFYELAFGLTDMGVSIQSLTRFSNFPISISIGEFAVCMIIYRMITLSVLGIAIFLITALAKNVMFSFGVCGFITLVPLIFSMSSKVFLKVSFFEVILGVGIAEKSSILWQLMGIPCVFLGMTLAGYMLARRE